MPLGEKGDGWGKISLNQWWVEMEESFLQHVFISPIEIWEILTGWNQGRRGPRRKLGIGNTGNAGAGNPSVNALLDVVGGVVGANSIGEAKRALEEKKCDDRATNARAWIYEKR